MEEQAVLIEHDAGVRTLRLNRPKALNSFTGAMHVELAAALEAAASDAARALHRPHRQRPGLLRRPGPRRSGGRTQPRAGRQADRRRCRDRALLPAARLARPLDAGAGDRRRQRRRGRRRRQPRLVLRPRRRGALGELHPGLRQDRPHPRLRRHLAPAAPGRPRQRDRAGPARRQARAPKTPSASA